MQCKRTGEWQCTHIVTQCRFLTFDAMYVWMNGRTNELSKQIAASFATRCILTCVKCVQPVILHSRDLINTVRFLICCNPFETQVNLLYVQWDIECSSNPFSLKFFASFRFFVCSLSFSSILKFCHGWVWSHTRILWTVNR